MTALAKNEPEGRMLTLADYEARIYLYKEQIGTGYIGIGRTLIEAKEAGVVPHGQWEQWVTHATGLSIQQAQRCMRAAREIREGSALAELEMSKALALLASGLSEEDREAMAKRAAENETTLRELTREIEAARKRETDQNDRIERQRRQIDQYLNRIEGFDEQMARVREKALAEGRAEAEQKIMGQNPVPGPEAEAEMQRLKAALRASEERLEKQAALRQAAQQELLNLRAQTARGDTAQEDRVDLSDKVELSVGVFIRTLGSLPHLGLQIATLPMASQEKIAACVGQIRDWVDSMRQALDTMCADGTVE